MLLLAQFAPTFYSALKKSAYARHTFYKNVIEMNRHTPLYATWHQQILDLVYPV